MELNADFSTRAVVHAAKLPWVPSPIAGIDRRMLDRIGDEVARATSIVRYAPQSAFSPHVHGGGEEFLVLDGVFADEHGEYLPGTYIRNPPASKHAPRSETGCIIFVKLWQFKPDDRIHVCLDTLALQFKTVPGRPGVAGKLLFVDDREEVWLERWLPGATVTCSVDGGLEMLVIDGAFSETGETFTAQSWLRLPAGATLEAVADPGGCRVWTKRLRKRIDCIAVPVRQPN